jgi:hypothetical protein
MLEAYSFNGHGLITELLIDDAFSVINYRQIRLSPLVRGSTLRQEGEGVC